MNIKAVFFDEDDTLIDHKMCEKSALEYMFKNLNIEYKQEYQDIFRPADKKFFSSIRNGSLKIEEKDVPKYRFKYFFESIGINVTKYELANELFWKGLASSSYLINGAEKIVKYLHNKGYKIYVVTNGLVKLQKPRVENSNIAKYISDIIVSEEVGIAKPNPDIFKFLLNKIELNQSEVIMIGDSVEKDLKGAKTIGIQTIWYNPNNMKNETDINPEYIINNLEEIVNIL